MTTEELIIKNRDGLRMPANLILPDGEPRGTAVVLHGLGGWRNQPIVVSPAETLARRGYAVLRFNDSNGITSPDGDFYRSTTTQYTKDVEDALAFMRTQPWSAGPITLVGHSLGGLVAAWYAAEHPEEVERLVLIAPAISWKTMWWAWLPIALIWLIRGHRMMLGIDGKKFALSPLWWMDFFKFDGHSYASKIAVPTLVISAELDHTVAHPHHQRALARRFAKGEHSMVAFADHDFDGHIDEVVDTIDQWLTSS
ncbi:MAG: alpha/beta fold hydrolase [Patescibacteria group bacterium]